MIDSFIGEFILSKNTGKGGSIFMINEAILIKNCEIE
jgi:hypothetical protein